MHLLRVWLGIGQEVVSNCIMHYMLCLFFLFLLHYYYYYYQIASFLLKLSLSQSMTSYNFQYSPLSHWRGRQCCVQLSTRLNGNYVKHFARNKCIIINVSLFGETSCPQWGGKEKKKSVNNQNFTYTDHRLVSSECILSVKKKNIKSTQLLCVAFLPCIFKNVIMAGNTSAFLYE